MVSTLFRSDRLILFKQIPSTNDYAADLLAEFPPEGTVIQALEQSAGKGQRGNRWESEVGKNLLMSMILYPAWLAPHKIFDLNLVISLAIVKALETFLSTHDIAIKWPNDILIERKKVCGILIENQLEGRVLKNSVVGIGLNVNQHIFPQQLLSKAASLKSFLQKDLSVSEVRDILLSKVELYYTRLQAGEHSALKLQYLTYLYGFRQTVRLMIDGKIYTALIQGVDDTGRLMVGIAGKTQAYNTQEMVWVDL